MEITAALEGLAALREPCEVELYSDSRYLCDSIAKGWIYGWQKKGWVKDRNKPVPNKDLWLKMLTMLARHKIRLHWLRGHAGHPENERCDELARAYAARKDLPADEPYESLVRNSAQGKDQ